MSLHPLEKYNNFYKMRIFDVKSIINWKTMVPYSDPVSSTRPLLGVKDGQGPSKASTKGK